MNNRTPAKNTIVDVAVKDGRFTTLVSALKKTGLVSTLQGTGPFTVFAPTDDAFNMLDLSNVNRETLKNVLLYHVVSGRYLSPSLRSIMQIKSVQGSPLNVHSTNGHIFINDAEVIISDIVTSNGVIHVINRVLQPPMRR